MTVDVRAQGWTGEVGLVTEPLRRLALDPERTTAFLCGPEPMMRFGAQALLDKGMAAERHPGVAGTQHAVRDRLVWALPARPAAGVPGRAGGRLRRRPSAA